MLQQHSSSSLSVVSSKAATVSRRTDVQKCCIFGHNRVLTKKRKHTPGLHLIPVLLYALRCAEAAVNAVIGSYCFGGLPNSCVDCSHSYSCLSFLFAVLLYSYSSRTAVPVFYLYEYDTSCFRTTGLKRLPRASKCPNLTLQSTLTLFGSSINRTASRSAWPVELRRTGPL